MPSDVIAFPVPVICWPWRLRWMEPIEFSANRPCVSCARDVAAPQFAPRPMCLYCGMETGFVPLIEIPLGTPLNAR